MSIVLSNVLPCPTLFNKSDLAGAHSECFGDFSLISAIRYLGAYLSDVIIGKFRKGAFIAQRVGNQTKAYCMMLIVAFRTPFEIFGNIVGFNPINVIHLGASAGVWDKSHSDKAVDAGSFQVATHNKGNTQIPCVADMSAQKFSRNVEFAGQPGRRKPVIFPIDGTDVPQIRNNVSIFKPFNRQPYFSHSQSPLWPILLSHWENVKDYIHKYGGRCVYC
jgi:hypothetical protein